LGQKIEKTDGTSWIGFLIPFIYCCVTSACMIPIALKVVPLKPIYISEDDAASSKKDKSSVVLEDVDN
jgi:hypothetical protein